MNKIKNSGKKPKLTPRQKKFVEFYLQSGSLAQSIRKAGYSTKNPTSSGNELLKNPLVKAHYDTRIAELESKGIAKTEEILKYWTAVMRGEYEDEQLMNIGIGEGKTKAEKVPVRVQSKERLKAAEMLAKVKGLFVNKSEIDLQGGIPIVIKDDI